VPQEKSTWSDYYDEAAQRNDYLQQKKKIIGDWIEEMKEIKTVADLGANEGEFSKLSAEKNIYTIAADLDPYCINRLYNKLKDSREKNIQPFVIDLSKPTPATGVNNEERSSFISRINADLILALALIHHLAIGKNIPFEMTADMFSRVGKKIIIEFAPKEDEKVKLMLEQKKDIYTDYAEANFERAFEKYFTVIDKKIIPGSVRTLYLMKRNEG
jgi:ribosomal protein L11 methylase PrmA